MIGSVVVIELFVVAVVTHLRRILGGLLRQSNVILVKKLKMDEGYEQSLGTTLSRRTTSARGQIIECDSCGPVLNPLDSSDHSLVEARLNAVGKENSMANLKFPLKSSTVSSSNYLTTGSDCLSNLI
jgi:hypothetical protein